MDGTATHIDLPNVREPYRMAEPIKMWFGRLTRLGPRNHHYIGLSSLHANVQFWGVVRPSEKHWESLLRGMQQTGSFSCQYNGMEQWITSWCDVAFHQNFWPLVIIRFRKIWCLHLYKIYAVVMYRVKLIVAVSYWLISLMNQTLAYPDCLAVSLSLLFFLRKRGSVFAGVGLCVCLSVCRSVITTTKKIVDGFVGRFLGGKGRPSSCFVTISRGMWK